MPNILWQYCNGVETGVSMIKDTTSCGTVALYDPYFFFFFWADHRATDFTYIKIGGIATRFKSELSMGRLMIGCKCVLPCVWLFRFIKHFSITLLYYLCKIIHILLFITTNIWLQHNPAYSGRHLDTNDILVETNNTQIGCQRILTPLASM